LKCVNVALPRCVASVRRFDPDESLVAGGRTAGAVFVGDDEACGCLVGELAGVASPAVVSRCWTQIPKIAIGTPAIVAIVVIVPAKPKRLPDAMRPPYLQHRASPQFVTLDGRPIGGRRERLRRYLDAIQVLSVPSAWT
jgi:hypothetical protein